MFNYVITLSYLYWPIYYGISLHPRWVKYTEPFYNGCD